MPMAGLFQSPPGQTIVSRSYDPGRLVELSRNGQLRRESVPGIHDATQPSLSHGHDARQTARQSAIRSLVDNSQLHHAETSTLLRPNITYRPNVASISDSNAIRAAFRTPRLEHGGSDGSSSTAGAGIVGSHELTAGHRLPYVGEYIGPAHQGQRPNTSSRSHRYDGGGLAPGALGGASGRSSPAFLLPTAGFMSAVIDTSSLPSMSGPSSPGSPSAQLYRERPATWFPYAEGHPDRPANKMWAAAASGRLVPGAHGHPLNPSAVSKLNGAGKVDVSLDAEEEEELAQLLGDGGGSRFDADGTGRTTSDAGDRVASAAYESSRRRSRVGADAVPTQSPTHQLLAATHSLTATQRAAIKRIRSAFSPYLFSDLLGAYHSFSSAKVPDFSIAVWEAASRVFSQALNAAKSDPALSADRRAYDAHARAVAETLAKCVAGTFSNARAPAPGASVHLHVNGDSPRAASASAASSKRGAHASGHPDAAWSAAKVATKFASIVAAEQGNFRRILDDQHRHLTSRLNPTNSIPAAAVVAGVHAASPVVFEHLRGTKNVQASARTSQPSPLLQQQQSSLRGIAGSSTSLSESLASDFGRAASPLGSAAGSPATNQRTEQFTSMLNDRASPMVGIRFDPFDKRARPPSIRMSPLVDFEDSVTGFVALRRTTTGSTRRPSTMFSVISTSRGASPAADAHVHGRSPSPALSDSLHALEQSVSGMSMGAGSIDAHNHFDGAFDRTSSSPSPAQDTATDGNASGLGIAVSPVNGNAVLYGRSFDVAAYQRNTQPHRPASRSSSTRPPSRSPVSFRTASPAPHNFLAASPALARVPGSKSAIADEDFLINTSAPLASSLSATLHSLSSVGAPACLAGNGQAGAIRAAVLSGDLHAPKMRVYTADGVRDATPLRRQRQDTNNSAAVTSASDFEGGASSSTFNQAALSSTGTSNAGAGRDGMVRVPSRFGIRASETINAGSPSSRASPVPAGVRKPGMFSASTRLDASSLQQQDMRNSATRYEASCVEASRWDTIGGGYAASATFGGNSGFDSSKTKSPSISMRMAFQGGNDVGQAQQFDDENLAAGSVYSVGDVKTRLSSGSYGGRVRSSSGPAHRTAGGPLPRSIGPSSSSGPSERPAAALMHPSLSALISAQVPGSAGASHEAAAMRKWPTARNSHNSAADASSNDARALQQQIIRTRVAYSDYDRLLKLSKMA